MDENLIEAKRLLLEYEEQSRIIQEKREAAKLVEEECGGAWRKQREIIDRLTEIVRTGHPPETWISKIFIIGDKGYLIDCRCGTSIEVHSVEHC